MYCTQTKFDYDIIFRVIGISRDYDVTIVSALSRIEHFLQKCLTLQILWVLVFCCAKFHKN